MANRFWVGGTGTWDNSSTTHWSTSSGGSAGASAPLTEDVIFDGNSGSGTCTLSDADQLNANSINASASSISTFTFSQNILCNGSWTLKSGLTINGGNFVIFLNSTGAYTLTTGGSSIGIQIQFNNSGTCTLQDDLVTTNTLILSKGTLDTNNKNVTCTTLSSALNNTRTLTMGSTLWTLTGTGTIWNFANTGTLTLNSNTSTIKVTDSGNTASTFIGGGKTFNNIWFARGASTASNTITGSNTFNDFKDDGSGNHSILFTAGTTQTVTTFTVSGSTGNTITINSAVASTSTHALTKSGGGTISSNYLNIQHSVASPSNTWYAGINSTNNQATSTAGSGWIFTLPPASNNFLTFI